MTTALIPTLTPAQFLSGWTVAVAAVPATEEIMPITEPLTIAIGAGATLPLVTATLGALGILLSRPLARRGEAKNGILSFLIVSIIMLIAVELWIVEAHPSWLFAFVIAIGLGFSGYSMIETIGTEMKALVGQLLSKASAFFPSRKGKP